MKDGLYTLDEARRELAKKECGTFGHNFNVVMRGDGKPETIVCDRCGRSWPVGDEANPGASRSLA